MIRDDFAMAVWVGLAIWLGLSLSELTNFVVRLLTHG